MALDMWCLALHLLSQVLGRSFGCVSYGHLASTVLEVGILRIWVMGLSGLPSLLAVAGLLGFAFVEILLPY